MLHVLRALRDVILDVATVTPGPHPGGDGRAPRRFETYLRRPSLLVHRRGDWNDQLFTWITNNGPRTAYYLEVRSPLGKLLKVLPFSRIEGAEIAVTKLKPHHLWRVVDHKLRLVASQTRNMEHRA